MAEAQLKCEESWCATQIRTIPISFTWTINNFSFMLKDKTDKLTSSYFSSDRSSRDIKWRLTVAKTVNNGYPYLSVTLCLSSATNSPVFAKYTIFILDSNNKKFILIDERTGVKFHESAREVNYFDKLSFESLNNSIYGTRNLLPDDILKLCCEITYTDSMEVISGKDYNVKSSTDQLLRDLERLLNSHSMSDVKLMANGEIFNAHKSILAARSPVFAAMFSHKMMEEDKGEVNIQDVNKDVLREVLHFIYTGKTKNIKKMAWGVLPVAEKYDLQGLKDECEFLLFTSLCIENAGEFLTFANFHNATKLKAKILDFVKWNSDAVMKTPGWNMLVRNNSDLLNDVIAVLSQLTTK